MHTFCGSSVRLASCQIPSIAALVSLI
ncbi:hypothetical protein SBA5_400012 [Candidatus Sulfotelmatomonas gaucii]|uniref:Uncharacterized protein n=1 Tax=Candidatus Sulfuritelmatomonas gaucii TaxID=2043161 RepID=A0A2N9LK34_9BACT|nr:hypothetical protein SBA5_400012 [Candidatus Sulfotelmatomonas gaucii]